MFETIDPENLLAAIRVGTALPGLSAAQIQDLREHFLAVERLVRDELPALTPYERASVEESLVTTATLKMPALAA